MTPSLSEIGTNSRSGWQRAVHPPGKAKKYALPCPVKLVEDTRRQPHSYAACDLSSADSVRFDP
jgi:hypothetical protein